MIRLAVRVRRADAETVLADLLELAPGGVEEVALEGELLEYALYGAPGELPRLPDLTAAAGDALVQISTSEVGEDWSERWRDFHRPVEIGAPAPTHGARARVPGLRVRPPWEPASARPASELCEVVIDPGQAFGTGAHATTTTVLELLLELAREREGGPLLDLGTGSGVLAIAAARLGFAPVLALDNDPASVHAARANARANRVRLDVRRLDLRREPLPPIHGPPPVLLANLLAPLLHELARTLERPPAHLLAGGMLAGEADAVARAFFAALGLRERARRERGEWAALWLAGP